MIDIYDEVGKIKDILEFGTTPETWERDGRLLARYYRDTGYKKSEAKALIKQKCEHYASASYDKNINFDRVNKFVENVYKKGKDGKYLDSLREIREIEISKEVLQWFLNLENNFILTDEEVIKEKKRRPKVSVKNKPMNFNRIKYLFTLFIWTKVQENYLDRPNVHYLKNYQQRFKKDANLKPSFNMSQERNLLYDLGFIDINHAIGIITTFMDKYPVFNIPITDDNRIIITGEDMYNCGYWLEKQKMGSFICQKCGREFAHYTKSNKEMGRKYCKECAKELKTHTHDKYCIDCGKKLEYNSLTKRLTNRCPECQAIYEQNQNTLSKRKHREKNNVPE